MKCCLFLASRCWALPYTFFGLLIGGFGLMTGGRVQYRSGVWEFYGGFATRFLDFLPLPCVLAFTLGHTVIGRSAEALDITRLHERVHVRQYERWGPLMGPAYLLCSVVLLLRGRDAYRDNPFEQQAYREAP